MGFRQKRHLENVDVYAYLAPAILFRKWTVTTRFEHACALAPSSAKEGQGLIAFPHGGKRRRTVGSDPEVRRDAELEEE